jgi:hypothetical protein
LGQLHTAVAPYPVVKALQVETAFPHGMRIRVIEEVPVGKVTIGGETIAVAGDGALLHDSGPVGQLPQIPLRVAPGGPRLTGSALEVAALLAAAPYRLLTHISQATSGSGHGLVAELRSGPSIYFGDGGRLRAKWIAAMAVLANSGASGAQYIDVTDPERPAAGVSGSSGALTGSVASGATVAGTTTPGG